MSPEQFVIIHAKHPRFVKSLFHELYDWLSLDLLLLVCGCIMLQEQRLSSLTRLTKCHIVISSASFFVYRFSTIVDKGTVLLVIDPSNGLNCNGRTHILHDISRSRGFPAPNTLPILRVVVSYVQFVAHRFGNHCACRRPSAYSYM